MTGGGEAARDDGSTFRGGRAPVRHGQRRWVGAFAAAAVVFGTGLFAFSAWEDHSATLERGWLTSERAARVLAEQADRSFAASRIVTDRMIAAAVENGVDWFRGDGWQSLREHAEVVPELGSIAVFDADARLVATNLERDPPSTTLADVDFVRLMRSGTVTEVIRPMRIGQLSGTWFYAYARPIVAAGEFRGIVQAAVHASQFGTLYRDLRLPAGSTVALFRTTDGATVMRWPLPEQPDGPVAAPAWAAAMAVAPDGRVQLATADAAGPPVLAAWRRLTERPVVAVATIPRAAALAPFRQRFVRDATVFALASLLMLLLARAALAATRRAERQQQELTEALGFTRRVLDNLFAFVGVMELDGTLVEVNRAPLEVANLTAADVVGRKFWDCPWWSHSAEVQDRLRDAWRRARQGEVVRYDVPIRTTGNGRMWIDFQLAPLRDDAGRITHLVPSGIDLTPRRNAEQASRASEERLSLALDAGGAVGTWDWDVPNDIVRADGRFAALYGIAPEEAAAGAPHAHFNASVHPADRSRVEAVVRRTLDVGGDFAAEYRVLRADGSEQWVLARGRCLHDDEGRPVRFPGVVVDITERKLAEERQQMLAAELDHRVKNILAVVQAMAQQSFREPGEESRLFVGRIAALAQAHSMLAESGWSGASLHRLAAAALAPHRQDGAADRITLAGPDLRLEPKAAQAMSLALHELATNAAKYGALSVSGGRVTVDWRIDAGPAARLVLTWGEAGGPPIAAPPARTGFGTRLIEGTLAYEFEGAARLDYRPEGLLATLELPTGHVAPPASATRIRGTMPAPPSDDPGGLRGRRILVVEDQHMIADEVAEALAEAGCTVVGPAGTLQDALRLAASASIDAAVLDVNLSGDMVWPAAQALRQRGIPFVFATVYAETMVPPPDLRDAPRLGKPMSTQKLLAAVAGLL